MSCFPSRLGKSQLYPWEMKPPGGACHCRGCRRERARGKSPSMGEEAPVGMTRAVTAWSGTGGSLILQRLPRERRAIEGPLLLPPGSERAARCTSVRCILATDVTKPHTARNRASRLKKKVKLEGRGMYKDPAGHDLDKQLTVEGDSGRRLPPINCPPWPMSGSC